MATYTYEYLLHEAKDTSNGYFDGIKLGMNSQITINTVKNADNSKTVNITIPKSTRLFLADDSDYYNNNYCAFIVIKYVVNGTTIQVPSAAAINKMIVKDSHRIHHSSPYNYSNCPTATEFKAFSDMVFLFHRGRQLSYGKQTNWYHELTSARTITFTLPSNAESSYEVYVSGCSMNTTTLCAYFFDRGYGSSALTDYNDGWTIPNYSWVTEATTKEDSSDVGGNACAYCDTDVEAGYITSNPLWEPNGVGSAITITDNGNNTATIKVPKFVVGAGNGIKPDANSTGERGYQGKYIFIEFLKSNGSSLAIYRRNFPNTTSDFSETFNLLEGTAKISVWAKGVSDYGDNVEKNKLNHSVVYYAAPIASNANLYYLSSNKSSKDDSFNPRINKQLTWEWSGFSPGTTNTQDVIKGFRLFLYKDPLSSSLTTGPTKYSYDNTHKLIVSTDNTLKGTSLPLLQNKPSDVTFDVIYKDSNGTATKITSGITSVQTSATTTECIDIDIPSGKTTNGSGSFTIIPKEFGFEKNDYCICEVGAYSKNGAGTKLFNGYQVKSCKLRNSVNVWVKVDDSKTLTGTEKLENDWVEAESVWVKVSNTGDLATDWVEAEGLWVKTATNTWSESS